MVSLNINMPESFFIDEIRSDFHVSSRIKQLWAVELDLLCEFDRICTKYNLRYFSIGGTLIGAARHKGFIPWDDDIDVAMMWSDFKLLCEIAPKECKYPYFFQCLSTDLYSTPDKARLRRSDTTGCTLWEYNNVYDKSSNRGIFIDIFPLFNVPDDEKQKVIYREEVVKFWKAVRGFIAEDASNHGCFTYDTDYNNYREDYRRLCEIYSIDQLRRLYLEKCASFDDKVTKQVGLTSFRANNPRWQWKREWFDDIIELEFENIVVKCPKYYDDILTWQFGNWHIPVKGAAQHEMHVFDPSISFAENNILLSRLSEFKRKK